jgi:hypothetical protein
MDVKEDSFLALLSDRNVNIQTVSLNRSIALILEDQDIF